jgi:hypothetical protein
LSGVGLNSEIELVIGGSLEVEMPAAINVCGSGVMDILAEQFTSTGFLLTKDESKRAETANSKTTNTFQKRGKNINYNNLTYQY